MTSITFAVDNDLRANVDKFSWVNWSELVREELINKDKREEDLKKFMKIVSKSKFTIKDAKSLSDKVKRSMHEELKRSGLI